MSLSLHQKKSLSLWRHTSRPEANPGKDWKKLTHDRYHSKKVGKDLDYEKNKKNLAWDLLALLNVIEHWAFAGTFKENMDYKEYETIKSYCVAIKNFRNKFHAHSKGELAIETVELLILSMKHLSDHLKDTKFSERVEYLKSELDILK